MTVAVPEVVDVVRAMPARELVLDGEAIALRPDGTPHAVPGSRCGGSAASSTSTRCGRAADHAVLLRRAVSRRRRRSSTSRSTRRVALLDGRRAAGNRGAAHRDRRARRRRRRSPQRALAAGHEGVMAKALDGVYAAGRRGPAWLKVKQARTLDLVVLAVEWGSGRRRGTLSNLHLGARDAERGGFVMLGKTFKGLTDEMLAWQTKQFLELEIGRDDYTVYVRPGSGRRDRVQRDPGEPAVSGRPRAALRAREALSQRQDRGRGRHVRDHPGDLPADDRSSRRRSGDRIRVHRGVGNVPISRGSGTVSGTDGYPSAAAMYATVYAERSRPHADATVPDPSAAASGSRRRRRWSSARSSARRSSSSRRR